MIIFRAKFLEQGVEVYHHLVGAEGTKIKYRETFIFFSPFPFPSPNFLYLCTQVSAITHSKIVMS